MTLSSCLITQPVHFDEPANSPPAISDAIGALNPLTEIVRLLPVTSDAGASSTPDVQLDVVVYDPDVDQALSIQVLVDRTPCPACVPNHGILNPSSALTGRDRRPLTLTIPHTLLPAVSCHNVRLLVSGGFQAGTQTPLEDGDVASAIWWVSSQNDSGASAEISTCP